MSDPAKTEICRHCGLPIYLNRWATWCHTDNFRADCRPTTVAEPVRG